MSSHDYFELRRLSDDLVYQFDRTQRPDGQVAYKRRDQDLWIIFKPEFGWVAYDETSQTLSGRSWNVLPKDQGDYPPKVSGSARRARSRMFMNSCTAQRQHEDVRRTVGDRSTSRKNGARIGMDFLTTSIGPDGTSSAARMRQKGRMV
jgi:hypothetical protein